MPNRQRKNKGGNSPWPGRKRVGLAYNKSLLYLVSGAFEDDKATPFAGMQKFWTQDSVARRTFEKPAFENERDVVYTAGDGRSCSAVANGEHHTRWF
jgi:hypothetical protein